MNRELLEQTKVEGARWIILLTAKVGGHVGATEDMILPVLRSKWLEVSAKFLRDEIDYLESRKLIETERPPVRAWRVKLTRHGRDVVDYVVDCEPGIDRPVKYWGGE